MTDRDRELGELLMAKNLAGRAVLNNALALAQARRADGEEVSLLQALISMGFLDLATAQAIQAEAPPPEGAEEALRAPSGRAEQAPAPDAPAAPDAVDLDDPFNESGAHAADPGGGLARLIPVLVGLIAVGCVALVLLLRGSGPADGATTSAATPDPTATPPPESLHELEARLEPLVEREAFAEAVALIESLPGALREQGGAALDQRLAGFQVLAGFQARIRRLIDAGAPSSELKRMVLALENEEYASGLLRLRAADELKVAARRILGEAAYDDLVVMGFVPDEPKPNAPRPGPRPEVDVGPPKPPSKRRAVDWLIGGVQDGPIGSEERRARFRRAAAAAAKRVEAARAAIAAEQAAVQARTEAEFERAKADPRPLAVPTQRGRPRGSGTLLFYNQRHFVLRVAGRPRIFTWADAPASTACDLLERAIDPERAEDLLRLGFLALRGSLFERARKAFRRAKALDPKVRVPDLDPYRRLARVFQGPGEVTDARVDLRYGFETSHETEDFEAPFGTRLRLHGGALVIANWFSLGKQSVAYASHRGRFARSVRIELERLPGKGRLLVGLGPQTELVLGPEGVGIGSLTTAPDLRLKGRVEPRTPVRMALLKVDAKRSRVVVKQGERLLLDQLVEEVVTWPLQLGLGVSDGDARLGRLRVTGAPDPEWLKRTRDEIPFRLEQALLRWRHEQGKGEPKLAQEYETTSAEDAPCLRGVSAEARALLAKARKTILASGISAATDLLRQALLRGRGRYWAVEYLLAQAEIAEAAHASSLEGALLRLNRAIAGVEDFYEALAARSTIHLRQGRITEARADAQAALKLRADYAPARLALAYAALQTGDLQTAVDEARLAAHLSGRPEARAELSRLEALRDGPSWNTHVIEESPRFRLQTDLLDRGPELLAVVEEAHRNAPRVFPILKARAGAVKRRADVFVFADKEDYHRHSWRTGGDRKENALGFFSPLSGQLFIYDSKQELSGGMLRVLRHEATHQWVHSLGLALPYWVNEALADYMGGYDAARGGSAPDLPELKALIEHARPPFDLYDLMTFSPSEFYSGNSFLKYAQAWSFVHYCMEGGDARLKQTFFDYLKAHTQGDASDKSRQLGVRLAHLYASTFHQLDMKAVAKRWWAYVLKLGKAAGLEVKTLRTKTD